MIRQCTIEDFEAIYTIINDAAQAYKGVIPADRWHEPYMSREALQHEIDAGVQFWGYVDNGELVGVMGIQDVAGTDGAEDVTLIRHAYVLTTRRGQGIDGKLLAQDTTLGTRLIGLQANTSANSPEELLGLDHLETEAPDAFARAMCEVRERFGTQILGGCCGTDDRHIAEIAKILTESSTIVKNPLWRMQ